ncbi:MAG: hypothetical protein ACE15C_10245 [Phycisphaerae bacterium]
MNTKSILIVASLVAIAVSMGRAAEAEKTLLLCDFEADSDLKLWDIRSGQARLVSDGAAHGRTALELTPGEGGAYIASTKLPKDWSAYDALLLDVFNTGDEPVTVNLLIADEAWQKQGGSYWNRHNSVATLSPGKNTLTIPVQGLYRGEAGSRNNDIKENIHPDSIIRLDLGFGRKGATAKVIVDNLRLVKVSRPDGVWAFDFGPASQAVALGWTGVSDETKFSDKPGYGWHPPAGAPSAGRARDTTFGPSMLRDFVEAGGCSFRVKAPAGKYAVTVFYENSGYWGGEQAQQRLRTIGCGGKTVWRQEKPDGAANCLWRFENVEPVGVDIWDTYMAKELAAPAVFEAEADSDGLTLKFDSDAAWGSRISGMIIHKAGDEAGAAWARRQMESLASEFRAMAVCLDKPARQVNAPESGFIAWPVRIEDTIKPNTVPDPLPAGAKFEISRIAVLGEYEPFSIAIRPLKDLGKCTLSLKPASGSQAVEADIAVVWYNTSRGFGTIAYRIEPFTVRPQTTVDLIKDVTRQIIVTFHVPQKPSGEAPWPPEFVKTLVVTGPDGKVLLEAPLKLAVHPIAMDRKCDYQMAFLGLAPPAMLGVDRQAAVLEETLSILKEHGLNAVSGGPAFKLAGWKDGQPVIEGLAEMDAYFAMLRKHGFAGPIGGYGGIRLAGINDRYQIGQTGRNMAREAGLPYDEALMKAWKAVDEHARKNGWPTIYYAMCDETRVRENAERELEFMNAMAKISKAFPKTVRTSGSYSVNFRTRPEDKNDMLYWHQRFFEALDISALNTHDETVMAEAAKLGKEIHIYNQGTSRYSFGLYQWSEYRKGVKARWQWHLNVLHGYQFFDLDGREPDTAMLCYGRKAVYPTIAFERCREGAEDFWLYNTLWNLVQKGAGGDEARKKAAKLLEDTVAGIKLGERLDPRGFDADALKVKVIEAIESLR